MTDIEETIAIIIALNRRLSSGTMFLCAYEGRNESEVVFRNMRHFGLEQNDAIILSLTPDGDDTVIGRLLTTEGRLFYFDFDPDNCDYSRLIDVPAQGKPDETDGLQQAEYLEEVAGAVLLKARGFLS
jgi:hypothetical protein